MSTYSCICVVCIVQTWNLSLLCVVLDRLCRGKHKRKKSEADPTPSDPEAVMFGESQNVRTFKTHKIVSKYS